MKYLEEIIPGRRYDYYDKKRSTLYTLKQGDRGVYGAGKCLYLRMQIGDSNPDHIATFTIKTDGYHCEQEDYGNRLWNKEDAIIEADKIVAKMIDVMA